MVPLQKRSAKDPKGERVLVSTECHLFNARHPISNEDDAVKNKGSGVGEGGTSMSCAVGFSVTFAALL